MLCSHSWLARRSASINSAPLAETDTKTWRPSAGCAFRATNPSSASEAITRVIDGGRTRSRSANAPGVIAPSLARVDSADNCDKETGESGRRNRNWRANRITASDKSLANRESISFTRQRIASGSSYAEQNTTGFRRSPTEGIGWSPMSSEPPEAAEPEPPALPAILLEPWPVIIVIAVGWLIAVILAFTVAGLHEWRPDRSGRLGGRGARHVDFPVATSRRAPGLARCAERPELNSKTTTEKEET